MVARRAVESSGPRLGRLRSGSGGCLSPSATWCGGAAFKRCTLLRCVDFGTWFASTAPMLAAAGLTLERGRVAAERPNEAVTAGVGKDQPPRHPTTYQPTQFQ
jgi:hypothetical protein